MGDPDLRSDETIIVRTPEVYVKSIPFEGIITNKRIVLVDRSKNTLPLKEIPLATIKDIDGGENAIRDPIVTITVITRSGDTRQMVFTFKRASGGNRSKERDEWVKRLKENVSSSFEQVIHKGIPVSDQPQKPLRSAPSPRIVVHDTTGQRAPPRTVPKKDEHTIHPVKKIIENVPSATARLAPVSNVPPQGFGTFCSRCGNKVPEDSGFCNRCGSAIIPPGSMVPQTPVTEYKTETRRPIESEIRTYEPLIERIPATLPPEPVQQVIVAIPEQNVEERPAPSVINNPPEPVAPPRQPESKVAAPQKEPVKKRLLPRLFSSKELSPTPLIPASMPATVTPPPQKPRRAIRMPGKKVFMAIGVIILLIVIIVAGVVFVYPMISGSESQEPGSSTVVPATTSTPATSSNVVSSGTIVPLETTAIGTPMTGVYAHISYIGSWNASYGMSAALQSSSDSGDRFFEIENATGPVEVIAEKRDSSTRHELVVELYKNGVILSSGKTSAGFGNVTISADAT